MSEPGWAHRMWEGWSSQERLEMAGVVLGHLFSLLAFPKHPTVRKRK